MDEGKLFGRGLGFPPRIGPDGRVAWSVGSQNIRESIRIILLTEMGERLMLPEFGGGLRSFLFEPNTPSTHRIIEDRVTKSLARWEPRIKVASVTVERDAVDERAALVLITYALVATGETDRLTLSVQLGG